MTPTGQASRQQVSAPSVGPERGNVGAARTPSEGRRGPRCRLARRQRATSRRPSGGQGFRTDPAGVRSRCLGPGVAPWVAPPTCRSRTTSSPATGVFGCIKAQGGRWKSAESAPSGAPLTPPASFPDVPSLRGPQRHPQVSCTHYPEAWSGARGQGPGISGRGSGAGVSGRGGPAGRPAAYPHHVSSPLQCEIEAQGGGGGSLGSDRLSAKCLRGRGVSS